MARTKGTMGIERYMDKYSRRIKTDKMPSKELKKGDWKKYDLKEYEKKIKQEEQVQFGLGNLHMLLGIICETTYWMKLIMNNFKGNGFYETEYMRLNRIRSKARELYIKRCGDQEIKKFPELMEPVDKELDKEDCVLLHFNLI